jgi:hypothetical protein
MPEHEQIPQPTELVYLPRRSWSPIFLVLGLALVVNGIYAEGFLFRGWVYLIAGAVIALVALRALISGTAHDFYERPRRQRQSASVLPAASLRAPAKRG